MTGKRREDLKARSAEETGVIENPSEDSQQQQKEREEVGW